MVVGGDITTVVSIVVDGRSETDERIAETIGVSRGSLSKWKNGHSIPSALYFVRLLSLADDPHLMLTYLLDKMDD